MTPNPLADGRREAERLIILACERAWAKREADRKVREQRLAEIPKQEPAE